MSVAAPPSAVWPWVRQIRLAPYSYDWVDNLGRRSPRTLSDLPDPVPGDRFSTSGGRFPLGRVLAVVPGESLTASIMGAVMSYVVAPDGPGSRLLLKIVVPRHWWSVPLAVGDWPMARKQLLTLKNLAEST
ncbi:MAG: polyketide cyclase [Frankiales bacterium]|nr:polyketide cyclase [Frankiales bacterium]